MKIRVADIILAIVIVIIGTASALYLSFRDTSVTVPQVVIRVDGEIYGTYPLDQDKTIEINNGNHTNNVTIKDGYVQMTKSNCDSQDCIKQGKINDGSKNIICLPHKITIEVKSSEKKYDNVSR